MDIDQLAGRARGGDQGEDRAHLPFARNVNVAYGHAGVGHACEALRSHISEHVRVGLQGWPLALFGQIEEQSDAEIEQLVELGPGLIGSSGPWVRPGQHLAVDGPVAVAGQIAHASPLWDRARSPSANSVIRSAMTT